MSGARDGQLRVQRGTDTTPYALQMYEDELELWLTLAQADVEEDAMRAGIPVLRGPYIIHYTDLPHDGDVLTLWTPEVRDVLLQLFVDFNTASDFSGGSQVSIGTPTSPYELINGAAGSEIGLALQVRGTVFSTTEPIQMIMNGSDPTSGYLELYTLTTRAVAP